MSTNETEEHAENITERDSEVGNLFIRAGYLRALAMIAGPDDRVWLLRASRSLCAYAEGRPTNRG